MHEESQTIVFIAFLLSRFMQMLGGLRANLNVSVQGIFELDEGRGENEGNVVVRVLKSNPLKGLDTWADNAWGGYLRIPWAYGLQLHPWLSHTIANGSRTRATLLTVCRH